MKTVFINGLGLIGSSLARAIKTADPTIKIIAADQDSTTLEFALKKQIIDRATNKLTAAQTADFIILATPVTIIIQTLKQLAKMKLKPGVIITDVGSTKTQVMTAAKSLSANTTFIGGHPMAGSHKSGVTAGRTDLFENAFYFLIAPAVDSCQINRLKELLRATKVKWLELSAVEHDYLVGQISHLPHIIAAALVNQTQRAFDHSALGMRMAAGGFKSITRIASSDPQMWTAILKTNRAVVAAQLTEYLQELTMIKQQLLAADQTAIYNFFAAAKTSRDQLGPEKVGRVPDFYDLFVNIPDQVGAIAQITKILAQAEINLVNLHILEIREEIDGILQLIFMSQMDQYQAKEILIGNNYQVIQRK
ncbi:prephenate dehydrogenase [Liquorilactobacillus sicerae]|uniref:prephenate dehydrogenase n=1 Tax=Liquorilactobacillus sicerae TaxID=1416943 RepID=UPI0024813A45|nr:prephenate dehydrogenase [Liquorilactobacillus sicerae]